MTVRRNEGIWWAVVLLDNLALAASMGLVTSLPLAMKVVGGFGRPHGLVVSSLGYVNVLVGTFQPHKRDALSSSLGYHEQGRCGKTVGGSRTLSRQCPGREIYI